MSALPRILFTVVFGSAFIAVHVFFYRRLVRDVTGHRGARVAAVLAMAAVILAGPVVRFGVLGPPPAWIVGATFAWWGVLLYTGLALIAVEVARFFLLKKQPQVPEAPRLIVDRPEAHEALLGPAAVGPSEERPAPTPPPAAPVEESTRRVFLARASAVGALAFGGGMTGYGAWRAFTPPEISEIPVYLPNLPRALAGFTLVQLSDVHVGPIIQTKFLDELVRVANSAKGDAVVITGDLVDGSPAQLGQYVARLARLQSRHGTFFVSGNHDYYSGWERWSEHLSGLGFQVLRNRRVSLGDAGGTLELLGVDDWGGHGGFSPRGYDLEKATTDLRPDSASVLLAHQPSNIEAVAKAGIGLQLSGHTHGGQVWPGTFLASLMFGDRVAGLSRTDDTQIYVSRGCGFVGPPIRVGSPPEIVKLVLLPA